MKSTNDRKVRFFLLRFALYLAAFFFALLILIAQGGVLSVQKEFPLHEPAPRSVFSPLPLTFVDEEETARLRKEKETQVLPLYGLDPKVTPLVLSQIHEAFKASVEKGKQEGEDLEKLSKALTVLSERLLGNGIVEDLEKKRLLEKGKTKIERWDPETQAQKVLEVGDLTSLSEAKQGAALWLEKEGVKDADLRRGGAGILIRSVHPNLLFDESATKEKIKQAADSVPPVTVEVKRGEMITQKGVLVTPAEQQRLIQIQKKMAQEQVESRLLTTCLFILLALLLCFLYSLEFEPRESESLRLLLLIFSTLLLTLLIEKITLVIPGSSPYLLPGALAGILLTILWKLPAGVLGALSIATLSAPLTEFRPEILLMILLGSLAGSFASKGVRKRIHFLRVGLAAGFVNSLVLVGFALFQDWPFSEASPLVLFGFANGFLGTALSFFLVPLFEALFNLTTDITLLELSDLNHPLLKRMVVEAPGTYHHSLVVSTLAEAACQEIGAKALLARVGCYFHDIGKIPRAEYFTENQTPQTAEKHKKLTPTMSCLVIMNHVKEGMELAKKYKLKDVIIRFIPEHQGKGVIYYFYRKALDEAAAGETVEADDFRYPGPKPQSRETAVALLADSVEAASRSLKEITPAAIRSLVRKIINEKFIDGQLDECDLTLKDLHKIQGSFIHNLMAIFHTRVDYPAPPKDPRRPDLFEADQFTKFR